MSDESSTVSCPNCGQTYGVTPEQRAQYGSQPITCTRCGTPFTVDGAIAAQSPPMATPAYPSGVPAGPPVSYASAGEFGVPQRTSGWAVTSLVLGCLSLFIPVIASIGAIVTGAVGMSKTRQPGVGGRGLAIAGLSLGIVGFVVSTCLMSAILLPSLGRAREAANRIKCASNLRQIGQAVMIYANENGGQFPDSPETLLANADILSDAFVCPSSADERAPGVTQQEQAANLVSRSGHLSYVYIGLGLTDRAGPNIVLVYEPLSNHNNDGMNVLFADGQVNWIPGNVAAGMVAELESGQNPPPSVAGF